MADEMTNQTSTETTDTASDDDFGQIFADAAAEDTAEEAPETDSADQTQTQEQPNFLDIKYNGATEHLTKEQAIELAQKGRNYDKVVEQRDQLRNSPEMATFSRQAQRAGLSLADYAKRLDEFQQTSDINTLAEDFKAKHPDASDEIAQEYAKTAYKEQQAQAAQQQAQEAAENEKAIQSEAEKQVNAFIKEYPNVDVNNLPPEVLSDINQNGETLLNAYRTYENKQLRAELAAARKNAENVSRGAGNLSANSEHGGDGDPFLAGLLG